MEYARRLQDLEGAPRTQMSHPVQFFQDVESQGRPKFTYVGELYFPAHRGTYTTQAKTKKGNRQSESRPPGSGSSGWRPQTASLRRVSLR